MTEQFLQVTNLRITLSGNSVIDDMTFGIKKNTLTTFLGPSGNGKTTVLRAIAGLNQNMTGTITLDGEQIQTTPVNQRHIGMIFQSYALFPNMSVFDNVAYGLRVRKESASTIDQKVNSMLTTVGLTEKKDSFPANLSGGQKQRVAIARAMVLEPKLLLLDEPLSALDAKIRVELRSQIRQYQQKLGITMLFVTHDQSEAMTISDDIIVMDQGKVQQQGSPMTIYTSPKNQFIAKFIGDHNVLNGDTLSQLGFTHIQGTVVTSTADYIIRPELFTVTKVNNDQIAIQGQLLSLTILGDRVRYQFETAHHVLLKVETLNRATLLPLNKPVTLYLDGNALEKVGD